MTISHTARSLLLGLLIAASLAPVRATAKEDGFKIIHVGDLAALLTKAPANLAIFDADPPSVRENEGIIPGAKLLPSSSRYDVAKELPREKDAKLVFYCYSTY